MWIYLFIYLFLFQGYVQEGFGLFLHSSIFSLLLSVPAIVIIYLPSINAGEPVGLVVFMSCETGGVQLEQVISVRVPTSSARSGTIASCHPPQVSPVPAPRLLGLLFSQFCPKDVLDWPERS